MDTIIKDWYLITFRFGEKVIGRALYGTVVRDNKGRFHAGSECKSSPIDVEVTEADSKTRVFRTLNSVWECIGPGAEIDVPHTAIPLFNQGVKPPYSTVLEAMSELEAGGYCSGIVNPAT